MSVFDYSTTPGSNGTISGINVAENCSPGGINDAIRQMMADVKTYVRAPEFRDTTDATKVMQFDVSSVASATTRTLTVPDATDTLVLLAAAQTLTNKSLTAPTITGALDVSGVTNDSAVRASLGLAIGSDVQAHDAQLDTFAALTAGQAGNLTDIAALTPADGNFIVGNGTDWVAESGATARTSLGLGSLATASSVNNSNWSGTDLAIANGGTGASDAGTARANLGLGSLATASSVNNSNWSGTDLAVVNGGTGASDASGARSNLGLGSIATQAANSVNIDGGTIDGTTIGASSAASARFTDVTATDTVDINLPSADGAELLKFSTPRAWRFLQNGTAGTTALELNSTVSAKSFLITSADRSTLADFGVNDTASDAYVHLLPSGGEMGLGTTSPEAKLHVKTGTGASSSWASVSSGILIESSGTTDSTYPFIIDSGLGQIFTVTDAGGVEAKGKIITDDDIRVKGNAFITGALSKGSGSFRIDHPLKPETHHLVHSFIEGPRADLIYRGTVTLAAGAATVDIDAAAGMTAGTFEALCRGAQVWVQNDTGWTQVRGSVTGATLSIEAGDAECTDTVSWLVIAERCDPHMMETDWTDENGRVIVEPEKPTRAADPQA